MNSAMEAGSLVPRPRCIPKRPMSPGSILFPVTIQCSEATCDFRAALEAVLARSAGADVQFDASIQGSHYPRPLLQLVVNSVHEQI